jgi:N-acetyl-gamma-glutamyl-phosphate reductase
MQLPVAILGASGYSGVEATRLLAAHPGFELKLATSDRWEGDALELRVGPIGAAGGLHYAAHPEHGADAARAAKGCVAALLCTPAEASLALAPALVAAGIKVIDLSGAFRLRDARAFAQFYRFEQTEPALLAEAMYGLPELGAEVRAAVAKARLVSNPGCYATAAALALAPLLEAGLLADESVIVDAASGTTGAGRKATEEMSFTEVADEFRAYRVLRHQHTPEIAQTLAAAARRDVPLTFTPHLLPIRRGILATSYARLAKGRTARELKQALLHKYASEPFVQVLGAPDQVSLRAVIGTNRAQVAVDCGGAPHDPDRVVVVSSIDNLLKGAAGQAIQNLNLMFGLPESAGLLHLRPL